jgi:CRISPR-associated protein Cas2
MAWEILVTYDVNTETKEGKRRLRKVAKACEGYGQRVQLSVFECRVSQAQFESLEARLLDIIDPTQDRLRLYRLPGDRERYVRVHGVPLEHDIREALIV